MIYQKSPIFVVYSDETAFGGVIHFSFLQKAYHSNIQIRSLRLLNPKLRFWLPIQLCRYLHVTEYYICLYVGMKHMCTHMHIGMYIHICMYVHIHVYRCIYIHTSTYRCI